MNIQACVRYNNHPAKYNLISVTQLIFLNAPAFASNINEKKFLMLRAPPPSTWHRSRYLPLLTSFHSDTPDTLASTAGIT
jgi:hypothetical protein